jgi:phage protein D
MSRDLSGLSVFIIAGTRSYTMEDLNAYRVQITDSEEGDSTIEIHCNDEDFRVTDNGLFQVGEVLGIRWGYSLHNEVSAERRGYVVVKPSTTYGEDGTLAVIKASTTSVLMSARRPQKSYGKITLKALVTDIANRNKLAVTITGGDEMVDGFSQGKWSDRETLRVLADRYGYLATFTDTSMDFAQRDFSKKPSLTFYYKQGEISNIISAQVQQNHAKDMGAGEKVAKTHFDPDSKAPHKAEVKNVTKVDLAAANPSAHAVSTQLVSTEVASPQAKTGEPGGVTGLFAGFGAKAMGMGGGNKVWDPSDITQLHSGPPTTDEASKSQATASALNAKTRKADLTMMVEGDPLLNAKQVIEVVGLSKRDSGKWWIIKVTHTLDLSSGYTCDMELARTGHNLKGSGAANPNTNNQNANGSNNTTVKPAVKVDLDTRKVSS